MTEAQGEMYGYDLSSWSCLSSACIFFSHFLHLAISPERVK